MAFLNQMVKTKTNYTPASYTADETFNIFNVHPGDLIRTGVVRTRVVFNGSGTDAKCKIGDGNANTRFCADGDVDETTTGLYQLLGLTSGTYYLRGEFLYTAADTIDMFFVANTAGTRTTGAFDIMFVFSKINPF